MTAVDFHDIKAPTPTFDTVAAEYAQLNAALDAAATTEQRLTVVREWDQLRRNLATWESLVHLRFEQDTRNEQYKQDREYLDELNPKLTELEVAMKRKLVESPYREPLEAELGPTAFALWGCEILTYDPVIEQDMVAESKLQADYTELLASAKFDFQGETLNLSGIAKFGQHPDRQVRRDALKLTWDWFAESGAKLDDIYDRLVKQRTSMARKLGFDNFIQLGYKRMNRIDYDQDDVDQYRAEVRQHVVPLCQEIYRWQQQQLGVDKLRWYDEPLFDPAGNPKPQGEHDWLIEQAKAMFDEMGGGLGEFFRMMVDSHLIDLKMREGKAGGGFCTDFASYKVPYIFANFNGTKGDVEVFTHEMGHAFQGYMSRDQKIRDYVWPTYESCEIHSMSLEFLTWPHMEKFFGAEGAERFRRIHLIQSILFLPYGVSVDHFQHEVYAHPDATPAERHAMWRELERVYLPQRDYDAIDYLEKGGRWQLQRHIYGSPFYYIDYTLAQCCALQFWLRAEENFSQAMDDYVALCRRGGEAPFTQLVRGAALTSPFEPGCLENVVGKARAELGIG